MAILAHEKMTARLWDNDERLNPGILEDLSDVYLNGIKHRRLYDQARLIDENGMEIVRVNFNNGRPAVVPRKELQNKKGRYYFEDAFRLGRGDVFVSPLDLNIENGKIEQPLKPVLRFAMPVFDQRGEKRGIVLLNYFGAKLLEHFSRHANTS
ncbi:MAG: GGDEF domain-containing protein, partial [Gammaproteobacteria bacterium]|nr:GGDEF domain-containing protein [Gammaproteobacteria bacterium]